MKGRGAGYGGCFRSWHPPGNKRRHKQASSLPKPSFGISSVRLKEGARFNLTAAVSKKGCGSGGGGVEFLPLIPRGGDKSKTFF